MPLNKIFIVLKSDFYISHIEFIPNVYMHAIINEIFSPISIWCFFLQFYQDTIDTTLYKFKVYNVLI